MVFQDPYGSLDPRMTVAEIIAEGLDIHHIAKTTHDRQERIYELLELVGLNREHANRFVHEFSGGQRQRIGIARALAVDPEFLVLDEPISALDVSIQAQVVNLLIDLQNRMGLTYLFVAHDLSMVKHISDRVAVLYLGSLVELTTSEELYSHPMHPYTQALLSAIPIPDPDVEQARDEGKIRLEGQVPSPIDPPPGCKFQGRCRYATERCRQEAPALRAAATSPPATAAQKSRGDGGLAEGPRQGSFAGPRWGGGGVPYGAGHRVHRRRPLQRSGGRQDRAAHDRLYGDVPPGGDAAGQGEKAGGPLQQQRLAQALSRRRCEDGAGRRVPGVRPSGGGSGLAAAAWVRPAAPHDRKTALRFAYADRRAVIRVGGYFMPFLMGYHLLEGAPGPRPTDRGGSGRCPLRF